ncbi:hypothetical protein F4861DRAFT_544952 [Xylaria intraflava]|nr:hypothetical protein F4861DRAFT_544952 [Xylaria intraflava]
MMDEKALGSLLVRNSRWEELRLKVLESICSQTAFREGPKLLIKTALSVVIFMSLTFAWYSSRISGVTFSPGKFNDTSLNVNENKTVDTITGGLRMVVFGGGDVATPNFLPGNQDDQQYTWTEIMCQKLECDSYVSLISRTDDIGGAVASNALLDAAYRRISNQDENATKLDYSWVAKQYPRPTQPDLATQISSFLSYPKPREVFTETVWVFNIGYWDVWYLAALPRRLATNVLDSIVRDLFFQIERLYQATQDKESIAFSNHYSNQGSAISLETPFMANDSPRAPFRIFLTRLFDISLTPGFASARPDPPHPHSRSDQLRNAAFLTKYWNTLLEAAVDDWLVTPDPDFWSTADTIDIEVVKALVGKKSRGVGKHKRKSDENKDNYDAGGILLPFRAIASYGMSSYLQGLMIDRQLRSTGLFDHNGLGATPLEYNFLDISMPCALPVSEDGPIEIDEAADVKKTIVVCQAPDSYLFYTEFILSQRAIYEIGSRAARRFLDQVEPRSKWRERAILRQEREKQEEKQREKQRERERAQEGYKTTDFTA